MGKELTQSYLMEVVTYNNLTGLFFWNKDRSGPVKKGEFAGGYQKSKGGKYFYHIICIDGRNYKAHRLAFLYATGKFPVGVVDHINGNGKDNRWENLRDVSHQENFKNSKTSLLNKSGCTGVFLRNDNNNWRAKIGVDYKTVNLGSFEDFFDAVCARKSAEIKYGFHENHGRSTILT